MSRTLQSDTPEQIRACLACDLPECNNCFGSGYMPTTVKSSRIEQLDPKTGEVVAVYGSVKDAGQALNISPRNISKVLTGTNYTAKGWGWRRRK